MAFIVLNEYIMPVKPNQLQQPINATPASLHLFPGFGEHRLPLDEHIEIAYLDNRRESQNPPIVLLHGIFDNKSTWFRLATRLAHHRLIAPDLVGHGFSSKPLFIDYPTHERYSPDMQSKFLADFITSLDLNKIILVGNSLGGGLALRLYLHYPELAKKICGLVLLDAAGYPQELPGHLRELGGWPGRLMTYASLRTLARRFGLLRLATLHTFRRSFYDRRKIPRELVDTALAVLQTNNIFHAYHLSAHNIIPPDIADFQQRFGEIDCPTLIFWGEQDRILDPAAALRFAADIPNSELHLLANCGHAPQLEYPDEVAQSIEQWLGEHL